MNHSFKIRRRFIEMLITGALLGTGVLLLGSRGEAAVTTASVTETVIPYETSGLPVGTSIQFTLSTLGDVTVDIYRLEDISDPLSADNQVASIQQQNLGVGGHTIFWNALWLLGGDLGRRNGNYQIVVTEDDGTPSVFTIPTLVQITSVDIHSLSVFPTVDDGGNTSFPYTISYSLAKASNVTVRIRNAAGSTVRTRISNLAQHGEETGPITLTWDGLDDNGRPVPIGVYTVLVDATDPATGDQAITRTRSVAVQSLASQSADAKSIFAGNNYIYPNPVRGADMTFQALVVRSGATIHLKIYTIAGDLVRSETYSGLGTGESRAFALNATNQAGKRLGRGLYYYVVREDDADGTLQTVKKLAVIP